MLSDRLMYSSKMEVKRGFDGLPDQRHDLEIDTAEEVLFPNGYFPAGLVFSRAANGTSAKIGVAGNKVPFFLFSQSDRPMASMLGTPPSEASTAAGGYVGGGYRKLRFYSGMGAFEVSTTEFVDATYAVDEPLTAAGFATPATYDAAAGRVTKTTYTSLAAIVGIVSLPYSSGTPSKNEHQMNALHFTTCYIPNRKVLVGS